MKTIYIIIIAVIFAIVYIPSSQAVGWDWGVKTPSQQQMESPPLGLKKGEVAIKQFPAVEMPVFGVYTAPGKKAMPNILADLNEKEVVYLKNLLTEICVLNYKLGVAFENEKWRNFSLGDLLNRRTAAYKLMNQIRGDLKKLHLKYADLILNYEKFFDTFFMFDNGMAFRPDDLMRSLWGEGKFLDEPKLVRDEVILNAKRGDPSPIMKWMVYYTDYVIPSLQREAKRQAGNRIRLVDPLWSLKQETYSGDLDTWGNFWSDVYADPRMFNEMPEMK